MLYCEIGIDFVLLLCYHSCRAQVVDEKMLYGTNSK